VLAMVVRVIRVAVRCRRSGIWGSSRLAATQAGGELGVWTGCYISRRKAGCLAATQAGEESGGSSTVLASGVWQWQYGTTTGSGSREHSST
jgi:hypothetical protein